MRYVRYEFLAGSVQHLHAFQCAVKGLADPQSLRIVMDVHFILQSALRRAVDLLH